MSELMTSEGYGPQKDFGTPLPINVAKMVTLNVDGQEITVLEGTSVMRAAELASVNVPKLCATDSLDAFGSCRMCLVEIEGRRKGDMIYLSVRNLRPIDKYQSNPGNQIALENIGERLVLAFGPRASISRAVDQTHYQVSMAFPYKE